MLQIKNLHSGYGSIPVLRGVNLTVQAGEFVGLWGHNGMGKSTLMRSIMGYMPASAGEVVFDGKDITGTLTFRRSRAGIGYVPQGRQIFPYLSVLDNLRMGAAIYPGNKEDVVARVLSQFPRLQTLATRDGGLLSGGEQQLLALARCLCGAPKLMLLDEPTEGIQPSIISEMADSLLRIRRASSLTLLLVEQNQEFIGALSDRVVTMQKGQLVSEHTAAEFLDSHPSFVAAESTC